MPFRPEDSSRSRAWRSLRVGACSALRTWSSCTGALVWLIGRRSPSCSAGAEGEPGLTSTKKLPSRKMRGRIFIVASLCSGRPFVSIRMVTSAACLPSSTWLIPVTLPTLTPATRTGEPLRTPLADGKTACTV